MKPRILNATRLCFPLAAAIAGCSLSAISSASAQSTYTWTNTTTGAQSWTTAGNWSSSTQYVSAPANELRFFADSTTTIGVIAQTFTSLPTTLSMNTLTLNGKGFLSGASSSTITVGTGSTWTIGDGTTSTVNLNANFGATAAAGFNTVVAASLTLNQANTLFAGAGTGGFTFSGNIGEAASSYGITKSGASAVTLSGSTLSFTGPLTVNGGSLFLTGNSNPGFAMTVNTGAILRIGNNTATQIGTSGNYSGNISTGTGGTLQLWSTSAQTLSGVISGAGGISKAYGGALTLSGSNNYTGKSQFLPQSTAGFTVNVSSFNSVVGGTASSSLGAPTTVANGTIDFGNGSAQASCTLNYTGPGETTDRVLNISFNGTATQTISASGSGLLTFSSAPTVNLSSGTRELILSGTGTGAFSQALPQLTAAGLFKSGAGTWTFSGANTYTGPTRVTAGTLVLANALALQNSPLDTTNSIAGTGSAGVKTTVTTLTMGGITGNKNLASVFTSALGGPLDATALGGYSGVTALTLNNAANTTSTYSGGIAEGATGMTLTKNGAGSQILTGTMGYTGATSVNAGVLGSNSTFSGPVTVANSAGLAPGASAGAFGTFTISDAGTSALTLNGSNNLYMDVSTASKDLIAVTGTTVLNGTSTVFLNPATGVAAGTYDLVTYAASTGSGSVVFANGTATLGDATLAVNAGNIQLTVGAGGLNNSVWVGTTATWDSGTNWNRNGVAAQAFSAGDFVTIDDTGSNAATITSAGTVSPAALTVNNSTKAFTISATIGGTGTPLVKLGTNTLNLSSLSNAYTGGTVINLGTVNITGTSNTNVDSVLGNASGGITLNGGRLQATSTNISGARIVTVNGTGSSMLVNKNNNFTTTGKLTGAGTLTTLDAGGNGTLSTYRFNSTANDFTGRLIGTNTIINVNSFADSTNNIVLNDGAVFTYGTGATGAASLTNRVIEFAGTTGATITNANTTAANTLAIGGGLLVTSAGNKTLTLGGVNTGNNTFGLVTNGPSSTISLNKIEAGTWSLNGANTHTGGTTLTAGTLRINNATALGAGSFIISGNGTFDNVTGSPLSVANPLTMSGGSPTFAGSSNMTITGPVTISGITAGSTRTITVSANTLTLTNDITESVAGLGLTKGGPGTMTLSSVNSSFTGLVSLAGGTTNVAKLANIGSNSSLGAGNASYTVRLNGGTMNYNGAGGDTTNRTIELAASAIINNNSTTGAIAFTAANVAQTGTASARTLTLGGSYTGGANSFGSIIGNSGTSPNLTSLVKNGNSTWILSGANTYTGTTTISGGTLALGANDVLPNASNVSIAAATLDVDTRTDTAGTLDVTAAATINLGTGGALAFANSSAVDWTGGSLNITGTYTPTSIRFGTTSGGLTTGQLAVISVNGSGAGTYTLDVDGYLVSSGGDAIPPTLTSITDNVTGGPVDISAPVTYTVTFNEDMDASTVTAADFSNAGTATASIGAPSETTPGVFTVVVTPSTSGTLRLQIPISAVLTDVAGNPLDNDPALLDDTTITVRTPYATWAAGFLPGADVSNPALNFDSDGLTNLQEYAFGTDPTASSGGSIEWTPGSPVGAVTQRGTPVVIEESGMYYAVYGRRVDHATAGVTYTQQFSPGLSVWGDFATAPTVIATDGTIEAVKVPFPGLFDFGSGPEKATFFRMEVSQ